jgi:hypothetical protein
MNTIFIPELTLEEVLEFRLAHRSDATLEDLRTGTVTFSKPVWEGNDVVWATAVMPDTPHYAVYDTGTNSLTVLRYQGGKWSLCGIRDIQNIYGVVWQMAAKLNGLLRSL